jgi:transposase
METISMVGIDLAKHSFQLHGVDDRGRCVWRKRVSRRRLLELMATLPRCVVAMESCSGSQYFGRRFAEMGHQVRIVPSQYVRPFLKTQKNNPNDAEAIVEAASRPAMRFVPLKAAWQQELQLLHRVRTRLLRDETALSNQLRSVLEEQGVVMGKGDKALRLRLQEVLAQGEGSLSDPLRALLEDLQEEWRAVQKRVGDYDSLVRKAARENEVCRRLQTIPGVGPHIATALVAAVGHPAHFQGGRQLSAWLGVVPRQYSTGDRERLLGITKHGDCHLRSLVIHGARALVRAVQRRPAAYAHRRLGRWILAKLGHKHPNRVAVAVANKNLRIMWALWTRGEEYQEGKAAA